MGAWMLWPRAEEILAERIARGKRWARKPFLSRGRGHGMDLLGLRVHLDEGDYANLADIEGVDFNVFNEDMCRYIWDCQD